MGVGKFDIRDYMWHIFEIFKYQKETCIEVAYDMFILNLELKVDRYKGAKKLKYRTARKQWEKLKDTERRKQKVIFMRLTDAHHLMKLIHAYENNDKKTFNDLCKSNTKKKED